MRLKLAIALMAATWTGCARAHAQSPASQQTSREQAIWEQVTRIRAAAPATQPYAEFFTAALRRQTELLERVRLYLTLYPGSTHRDEALRLELTALFEIGTLSGGELDPLRERVRQILRDPPSRTALHEAAYWNMICERTGRPATTRPTSTPITQTDSLSLNAYRQYIERYPRSRYAPRLSTILFEDALRRGDRQRARELAARLKEAFPQHALTHMLAARLARDAAVGKPFRLQFDDARGQRVDTGQWRNQVVLIVVWAGFEPRARDRVRAVEAFRASHRDLRVVGVNLDDSRESLESASRELAIEWPQLHDELGWAGEFVRKWAVRSIPMVFVLDRSGRLAGWSADENWRRLAAKALEN